MNPKSVSTREVEINGPGSVIVSDEVHVAVKARSGIPKSVFSVDVEDWFHILDLASTPPLAEWDSLPSRVEKNFMHLLDLFTEKQVRVTCFFLGWVGERFPHLVREAASRGHEIASHGYAHQLVYNMTPQAFFDDAARSKKSLEDLTGYRVQGYRSSGFSVTEDTPWFFEKLVEAGYQYDSSVFPGPRGHGGLRDGRLAPYVVPNCGRALIEFPVTVERLLGKPLCFFGGGYLRLFPYSVIRRMAQRVLSDGRPVIFYIHPREIDPEHPRLPMGAVRRFKSYVNLQSTEQKIRRILTEFRLATFSELIKEEFEGFRN